MTDDCTEALLLFIRETLTNGSFTLHAGAAFPNERWERGDDGVANRQAAPPRRSLTLQDDVRTSPLFEITSEAVRNDSDFGAIVGGIVGDPMTITPFDETTVINSALNALITESETLEMNEEAVRDEVATMRRFVNATERTSTVLIPLPGLRSALFPIGLEDGYQIGELTDDEINACANAGILQPLNPMIPVLMAHECVGVRIAITTPAIKVAPGSLRDFPGDLNLDPLHPERLAALPAPPEGLKALAVPHKFGDRAPWHLDELVNDILFVMRLARPERIATAGAVHVQQGDFIRNSYKRMTHATYQSTVTNYDVDPMTAACIQELWGRLRSSRTHLLPRICLRRFNAAMDRTSLEDALVDHVIAAEALFLKDAGGPEERGELGFRLALRAGALLEGSGLQRRSTFKFMKKAYDLRSKVAHGGDLGQEVSVPERGSVPIGQFVDDLAQMMREALRKAVEEYSSQSNFATQPYWDGLLLGPREAVERAAAPDVPSKDA